MLKEELLAALKLREESVKFAGCTLIAREMPSALDVAAFVDNEDMTYKLVVRCVFDEAGAQVFSDEDIPALKGGSKIRLLPLIQAVQRVNGFDLEADAKNSAAAPA